MTTKGCSEEGCERIHYARGLCNPHYQRKRLGYSGPPLSGLPFDVRFWRKADKDGPVPEDRPEMGPCWIWTGGKNKGGYGQFGRPTRSAHCIAYELLVGPIPKGLEIDHLCHSRSLTCPGGDTCPHRACVNPAHMEPVTRGENQRRSRSVSGLNMAKTHCDAGHELSGENLHVCPEGSVTPGKRTCRECGRLKSQRYRNGAGG